MGQLFEIVFVRPVVDVPLCLDILSAARTILPVPGVAFRMVIAAQSKATMIAIAAIPSIRKQDVLAFIVTNPLAATVRFRQVGGLAAQSTPWARGLRAFSAPDVLTLFFRCHTCSYISVQRNCQPCRGYRQLTNQTV
jgi:hypothetical protein